MIFNVSWTPEVSVTWYVEVVGEPSDLVMLADGLTDKSACLTRRAEHFLLSSTEFTGLTDPGEVESIAAILLAQISGAARLILGSPSSLATGNLERVDNDGRRHQFIMTKPGVLTIRAFPVTVRIGRPDGSEEVHRPADPIRKALVAARGDDALAKALRLRDRTAFGWADLYRLFEVVEAGVGSAALVARTWTTVAQMKRFKHSANSVGASGDGARHGTESTLPPTAPMSLGEGQRFVDGLLERWLRDRAS